MIEDGLFKSVVGRRSKNFACQNAETRVGRGCGGVCIETHLADLLRSRVGWGWLARVGLGAAQLYDQEQRDGNAQPEDA